MGHSTGFPFFPLCRNAHTFLYIHKHTHIHKSKAFFTLQIRLWKLDYNNSLFALRLFELLELWEPYTHTTSHLIF